MSKQRVGRPSKLGHGAKSQVFSLRLKPEICAVLKELSQAEGGSMAFHAERLIEAGLGRGILADIRSAIREEFERHEANLPTPIPVDTGRIHEAFEQVPA